LTSGYENKTALTEKTKNAENKEFAVTSPQINKAMECVMTVLRYRMSGVQTA